VVETTDIPAKDRKPPGPKNQGAALAAIKTAMMSSGKQVLTVEEALKAIYAGTEMPRNRAHEAIKGLIENCYLKHSPMGGIEVVLD
jgi:hypothetical protein